jgi:hypothetical protein
MSRVSFRVIFGLFLLLAVGCGAKEPFRLVMASGKVTYEDGSLIPVDSLTVTFLSETPPIDPKTYPKPGMGIVDKATGEFHAITTHKANDGLVRGRHKVVLGTPRGPVLPSIVPSEYCNSAKTPLEVDTDSQPFELKVRKPK